MQGQGWGPIYEELAKADGALFIMPVQQVDSVGPVKVAIVFFNMESSLSLVRRGFAQAAGL